MVCRDGIRAKWFFFIYLNVTKSLVGMILSCRYYSACTHICSVRCNNRVIAVSGATYTHIRIFIDSDARRGDVELTLIFSYAIFTNVYNTYIPYHKRTRQTVRA